MEKGFEREVLDRLISIETKLESADLKSIREDSTEALNLSKANLKDISEMKDNSKWLWRTVVGSIVLWILGIIYSLIGSVK